MCVVAVKFILCALGYIAEVVLQNGGQGNGMPEDDENLLAGGDCVDSEMQELMSNVDNVCISFVYCYILCFYAHQLTVGPHHQLTCCLKSQCVKVHH